MNERLSRQSDPTPVKCDSCGWKGKVQDCLHSYQGDGTTTSKGEPTGEVEPVDFCPKCGSDQLLNLEEEGVLA